MKKTTLPTSLLAALLLGTGSLALAQSSFSLQGIGQFASQRDWPGALSYGVRWTQAEPNNPDAWYAVSLAQENMGQLPGAIRVRRKTFACCKGKFRRASTVSR